jgi:hypothetical protein
LRCLKARAIRFNLFLASLKKGFPLLSLAPEPRAIPYSSLYSKYLVLKQCIIEAI